uniref:Uncharacterized protein n=1 Tax=Meloidogyne enterolobii TaxID=390850 RepID=A0A6V7VVP0_MELEN|nr:unnamed protein product [Meloidogyne enterolobii]
MLLVKNSSNAARLLVLFLLANLIVDVACKQSLDDAPQFRIKRDAEQGGGKAVYILVGIGVFLALIIAALVCFFICKSKDEDDGKTKTIDKTIEAKPIGRKTMTKKK